MRYFKNFICFILSLVLLSGLSYSQSRETSALEGRVADEEGTALPGAEVTIASPNMMGGTQSRIADAEGKFRFAGLQPGTYDVDASLSGFTSARREGVRLYAGQTLTADFGLKIGTLEEEITVIAKVPLIDVKDSQVGTHLVDEKVIKDVIFARDYYHYWVMDLAPGTVSATYHGVAAYGAESRTTSAYLMDGVEMSHQSSGSSWALVPHNVFEEGKVMGLGAPAEYDGFRGLVLSMVTKSGGNSFDGSATIIFSDYAWLNTNIDFEDPKFKLYSEPRRMRTVDPYFELGGPILKDKLWFYGSFRYVYNVYRYEFQDSPQKNPKLFGKVTWQPSPSTRVQAGMYYGGYIYDNKDMGPFRSEEASSYEYSPAYVYNFSVLHTFSDTTLMEFKVGAASQHSNSGGYAGGFPGRDVSGYYDASTGMYSKNYYRWTGGGGHRITVNPSLSHHADDFIKGDHDFKFGLEYSTLSDRREREYNGGFWYVNNRYSFADNQFHDYAYEYSFIRKPKGTRVSVYVQDSWKIAENFTINPGIRFNLYRGSLVSVGKTLFKASAFSPRIGLTWDIFGDHTTALKAHYGRYQKKFTTNMWHAATTGMNDWIMYEVMPDGSKVEQFRENFSNPATIDTSLTYPLVDQFTIGLEREVGKDLSVGMNIVYKKWQNFLFRINSAATYDLVTFTFTDEHGVEQTEQAYNKTSPSAADTFYITNPKASDYDSIIVDPRKDYWGFVVEFNKRFSNNWMLAGSYTWSKTTETSQSSDPNTQLNALWNGEPVAYPFHNFKLYGTFLLPLDITLSPTFNYRSGTRWARNLRAPVLGNPSINIEKRGINQYPHYLNFDLRVEKTFTLKGDFRLGFVVDMYNVLNLGREERIVSRITHGNFGLADRFNMGRQYRATVRIYF